MARTCSDGAFCLRGARGPALSCVVGDGAFVGSGTTVVAPNEIGAGATTGAGAVVTRSARVGDGEVWVGVPARQLKNASSQEDGGESPKEGTKEE